MGDADATVSAAAPTAADTAAVVPAEDAASSSTASSSTVRVVVMRHSERADEAPHHKAVQYPGLGKRKVWWPLHDAPLTMRGARGATMAAAKMRSVLENPSEYFFDGVHTSPYVRCMMTATAVSRTLELPLTVNPFLGCCAEYSRVSYKRGASPKFLEQRLWSEVTGEGVVAHELSREDGTPSSTDQFREHLELRAVRAARAGKPAILAVTHREGLRVLDDAASEERMITPYCAVREYDLEVESMTWRLVHDSKILRPEPASAHHALGKPQSYRFAFGDPDGSSVPDTEHLVAEPVLS